MERDGARWSERERDRGVHRRRHKDKAAKDKEIQQEGGPSRHRRFRELLGFMLHRSFDDISDKAAGSQQPDVRAVGALGRFEAPRRRLVHPLERAVLHAEAQ
eukprot:scaffold286_cov247-Pinguiococcus_pyrenoidosus.AAC.24